VDWRAVIRETLHEHGGLATRQQLLARVPRVILDGHVGRRNLQRVFPHVYREKGLPVDGRSWLRGALLHAGPKAALSHTTALAVWGIRPLERPLHLTVDQGVRRAGTQGLVVHRRLQFAPTAPQCLLRRDLLVTALARTVIDSWPLLPVRERRPLALEVTRSGMTTAEQLREALAERGNVGGHRFLAQTIDLIDDGCQRELEALGVLNVFRHRDLPPSIGQYRVEVAVGAVRLDRAWPEVKLAVELDGAKHHTAPEDRRRDLARDTALAAVGWVVLRFTYADVLRDSAVVRRRVLDAYRTRAAQLRAG
jgi:very-short-patch-repair endonuclease